MRWLRPQVSALAQTLRDLKLSVWFDAHLEPGTPFSATISREVREARCVLACCSNDAFPDGGDKNGWVLGEATVGHERGVLVPVMLEPATLDPPWNTLHTIDISDWAQPDGVGPLDAENWLKVVRRQRPANQERWPEPDARPRFNSAGAALGLGSEWRRGEGPK